MLPGIILFPVFLILVFISPTAVDILGKAISIPDLNLANKSFVFGEDVFSNIFERYRRVSFVLKPFYFAAIMTIKNLQLEHKMLPPVLVIFVLL